ncbi:MAG: hypothetical protein AVDCRST_MAG69-1157 [uncultured Solirubrobacteraceae bacterium]|uniref:Uncharacterized protein n=1 Tax=uncultured Solirubrobacteraceae bacterium TaxID=1162706 RepID=A0A6J4S2D5_9ACTN|nr:MAG: hypothetical protein AVDCRST_MAG69-1157 [uncultured Solirubrobacteraceae bacterium]
MRSPLHPVLAAASATALAMSAAPALAIAAPPDWRNPVSGGLLRPFDRGNHAYAA